MIIGICGGSGSGKTTLLKRLYTKFGDLKPSIFSMDNYYYPIEKQQRDSNGHYNFDLPSALDEEKLTSDLNHLKNGNQIIIAREGSQLYKAWYDGFIVTGNGFIIFEYTGGYSFNPALTTTMHIDDVVIN